MESNLLKLFGDVDYLAECASNVDLRCHINYIRSERIYARDNSETGAYFSAVCKSHCKSIDAAFLVLFVYSLHDFEEWPKNKPLEIEKNEWKGYLRNIWIPEYLLNDKAMSISFRQTNDIERFEIADNIIGSAISSPVLSIIHYGYEERYSFEYIIETETEFIDFQSWTTA